VQTRAAAKQRYIDDIDVVVANVSSRLQLLPLLLVLVTSLTLAHNEHVIVIINKQFPARRRDVTAAAAAVCHAPATAPGH